MSNLGLGNLHESGSRSSAGTSRSLLVRVRADDSSAWERLVWLYSPLVAHWCRRWQLPAEDMADIFQEVFQAVAAHIAAFRSDRESGTFRGWLRTITTNKINDYFRKQQREPRAAGGSEALQQFAQLPAPEADEASGSSPVDDESAVERTLFRRALELIRDEFEPRTWQAFWLTTVESRSAREAADALAMSPGAVRVAKSRVLQRLRAELGDL